MEKLKMELVNHTEQNIEKIAALFPNAITETTDEKDLHWPALQHGQRL